MSKISERESRIADRRRFLKSFAIGAAAAPLFSMTRNLMATPGAPAATDLCYSNKRLLTGNDLTWLGAFKVPRNVGLTGSNPEGTLAARYVNGQLRFMMQASPADSNAIIEFGYPGVGQSIGSAPRASMIKNWGDVYGSLRTGVNGGAVPNKLDTAIYWDEPTQSLFWLYHDSYNVIGAQHPVVGCTRFNDATGTFQSFGPWQTALSPHQTHRLMLRLPPWFAAQYTGGKTMALGCIGTSSGNASSSWGPALAALQSDIGPGVSAYPTRTAIPMTKLVGYSIVNRARRDSNYVAHGNPDISGGYWTQIDGYGGTGCWVETPNTQGMVFFQMRGTGHIWYGTDHCIAHGLPDTSATGQTGPHCTSSKPMMYIYDPQDLGLVAQGQKQSHQLSALEVDMTSKGVWTGHYQHMNGSYFDPSTNRLYVSNRAGDAATQTEVYPLINVFQVA